MSMYIAVPLVFVAGYLLGCFNGAVLISHRIFHDDVRRHGSGNAGLTNFYRTYGARYALLVIACDMGKCAIATVFGGLLFRYFWQDWTLGVLIAGLGCILGHLFPVFYQFKGGKGILAGSILIIMMDWRIAAIAWCLFILAVALTRYVSLGSVSAASSVAVSAFFVYDRPIYIALAVIIAALVVWSHRANIVRLLRGNESKFKFHVDPPQK